MSHVVPCHGMPCHAILCCPMPCRAVSSHPMPCHAVSHSSTSLTWRTCSSHPQRCHQHQQCRYPLPARTLSWTSTRPCPVPVAGRVLLAGPCIMHCLFVSAFPVCNSIRQTVVLLIQWCLIFDFLKYHKWMGRQLAGHPLYMSSNTYLNI